MCLDLRDVTQGGWVHLSSGSLLGLYSFKEKVGNAVVGLLCEEVLRWRMVLTMKFLVGGVVVGPRLPLVELLNRRDGIGLDMRK